MGVIASRSGVARMRLDLGAGIELLAVAEGFGRIDGVPTGNAALQRLRIGFERRARGDRMARALERPEAAAALLTGEIARVNDALHARSASHQDFVSAGCSLTAALVVRRRVTLAHVGATSAALEGHVGGTRALTPQHVAFDLPVRVLARALGAEARVEPAIVTFDVESGDVLVLCDVRERRALERRFGRGDVAISPPERRRRATLLVRAAAAGAFALAILCVR